MSALKMNSAQASQQKQFEMTATLGAQNSEKRDT